MKIIVNFMEEKKGFSGQILKLGAIAGAIASIVALTDSLGITHITKKEASEQTTVVSNNEVKPPNPVTVPNNVATPNNISVPTNTPISNKEDAVKPIAKRSIDVWNQLGIAIDILSHNNDPDQVVKNIQASNNVLSGIETYGIDGDLAVFVNEIKGIIKSMTGLVIKYDGMEENKRKELMEKDIPELTKVMSKMERLDNDMKNLSVDLNDRYGKFGYVFESKRW
jgi:ribosomal protein S13